MDNLTHSLAGAILGQMGLKQKTGLAMPTLIIAANIPDIDAVATLFGEHQHLAIRRGITHGPIAMLVLPLILWGIMLWYDRWQDKRGKRPQTRPPVHKGWLLALAYIGCLSHPALDWMNIYGIRFLEPFSSEWFFGNTLFIIDIWIWAALALAVWVSIRRERSGQGEWKSPAWLGFTAICAYIFANGLITQRAEAETEKFVEQELGEIPTLVVASPPPVAFWDREVLWRNDEFYGSRRYSLIEREGEAFWESGPRDPYAKFPTGVTDELLDQIASQDEEAAAFLFWARMPIIVREENLLVISDQRFSDPRASGRFTHRTPIPWGDKEAGK